MTLSNPSRHLPISISHYLCPADWPLPRFLNAVAERGFSGVALTERALTEMPVECIRRELRERKLSISSLNSAGFFTWQGEKRNWQERRNRDLLDWSVALDRAPLNLIVGGTGEQPLAHARSMVLEAIGPFVQEADRLGVPLMLEPLHPLRVRDKSCINTLADYERLQSSYPSLRLTLDLFHAWWDPDVERAFVDHGDRIGVLQICDIIDDGVPRRVPLDEGFLDWRSFVQQARKSFPQVSVELELFADQLPGRDVEEILTQASRIFADFRLGAAQ